jgi:CheY-like chemotaxis protein
MVRILVVEDDPLIREFVVEALREEGHQVIHAADGEQALECCRRRAADVLITDVKLPGQLDGWQIAERCREMIRNCRSSTRQDFRPAHLDR